MKIRVSWKDPDWDCWPQEQLKKAGWDDEKIYEFFKPLLAKGLGEYLTLEIDTDTLEVTVLPRK